MDGKAFVVPDRPNYPVDKLSPEVNAAINAVVPEEGPLDSPDFDAVAFINAKFPDENSLEGVSACV